jgi:hypothetical protein
MAANGFVSAVLVRLPKLRVAVLRELVAQAHRCVARA